MAKARHVHHNLMAKGGSLTERLQGIHRRVLAVMPNIERIACALYDADSDMLKTFINSTRHGIPIAGYDFPLGESASLSHLADTGECRVIDDIKATIYPNSLHSSWLLEQGYQSSFTIPLYDMGDFIGFMFFNSLDKAAFQAEYQRDTLLFSNLMTMSIVTEKEAVRSILNSATVAREIAKLRDFETGAHLDRMALYARVIARAVATHYSLSDEYVEHIFLFAPLHDIGKIGIPDSILLKPGPLTGEERLIMQTHVKLGVELATNVLLRTGVDRIPNSSIMINIIGGHHELLDGSGYPEGLSGDEIPIEARIIAAADIFDALTTRRPYKEPWNTDDAIMELEHLVAAGKLDSLCVSALKEHAADVEQIRLNNMDPY